MACWWDDYIGLPFLSKGRDRRGLDCWGLLRLVHEDLLGIVHPSYDETYTIAAANREVSNAFCSGLEGPWEEVTVPKGLDVVILTLSGKPFHCGIVTIPGYMLHILKGCNSIIEPYNSRHWERRIDGIYRYKQ